jgi:excisionase family DNA binding protein
MSKTSSTGEAAPALLSVAQAAKFLNLAPDRLRDLINRGDIRAVDVSFGRKRPTYRLRMVDIEAFIASRMTTPATAAEPRSKPYRGKYY